MQSIETITPGLLLGLSSGATCLATCAPVLVPLFLGEASSSRSNARLLVEFLGGRLLGYLVFACMAWSAGRLVTHSVTLGPRAVGTMTVSLGVLMMVHGAMKLAGRKPALATPHSQCLVSPWTARRWLQETPRLIPAALGLFSGLNVCPPFIVALSEGAASRSIGGSLLFFAAFFLGTSLFFVPTPFIGVFRKQQALEHAGAFAALLVGLYYLYTGLLHFLITTSS